MTIESLSPALDIQKWIMDDQAAITQEFFNKADKQIILEVQSAFDGSRQTQNTHPTASKWDPTSLAALLKRKTYPKGGGAGVTQAFFKNAATLKDTGTLQRSFRIADLRTDPKKDFVLVIDSGDDSHKVQILNQGGVLNIGGRSFKVPARRFLELNDRVQEEIGRMYEEAQS